MKWIAILLFLIGMVPVIAHGRFENEFLRLSILIITYSLTYFAYLHWLVRIQGLIAHICVILFMESYYLREYLL